MISEAQQKEIRHSACTNRAQRRLQAIEHIETGQLDTQASYGILHAFMSAARQNTV